MAKILECAKVDPSSGCQHVVRGETEEEILDQSGGAREGTWHSGGDARAHRTSQSEHP